MSIIISLNKNLFSKNRNFFYNSKIRIININIIQKTKGADAPSIYYLNKNYFIHYLTPCIIFFNLGEMSNNKTAAAPGRITNTIKNSNKLVTVTPKKLG